jgi:IstB-like ATP binding protein
LPARAGPRVRRRRKRAGRHLACSGAIPQPCPGCRSARMPRRYSRRVAPRAHRCRRDPRLASHWPFEQWGHFLPVQTTAASLLDRLLHHAIVVVSSGESSWMKESTCPKWQPRRASDPAMTRYADRTGGDAPLNFETPGRTFNWPHRTGRVDFHLAACVHTQRATSGDFRPAIDTGGARLGRAGRRRFAMCVQAATSASALPRPTTTPGASCTSEREDGTRFRNSLVRPLNC